MTARDAGSDYEPVIGLEIHVQLATRTKMFCGCENRYGAEPNTAVCPVCLGLPGALPVPNARAVELAVRAALGLGCTVHGTSVFARKNYFYPDLPKGYQITQYDRPLATGGRFGSDGAAGEAGSVDTIDPAPPGVRIRRLHLEEDSGKSLHDRVVGRTALDFNRAGVPLIEIVTEPELRSPEEARAFLTRLKRVLEYLGVSDCDMEKGSLRVDANLSVRPAGEAEPGTKTEVKNLNSFANVARALAYEAERQADELRGGGDVVQETRRWDAFAGTTRVLRSKEQIRDYRYFPEPDLPALVLDAAALAEVRTGIPELPETRAARFREEYGLSEYDAGVLTASRGLADYFEAVLSAGSEEERSPGAPSGVDPKPAANWVMGEVLAWLNERGETIDRYPVPAGGLTELIALVEAGRVSGTAARTVLARMADTGRPASAVVEAEGLGRVEDEDRLERWVREALAKHPEEAERLRKGEAKLVGFFMGQVMELSGGRADPQRCSELLRSRVTQG